MKLAIHKQTCKGQIVTDQEALDLTETHRVVDAKKTSITSAGAHFVDVWGGTWMLKPDGETVCTVGVMDKWS